MKLIVGSTGLVGTSLLEQDKYDFCFNSKNINTFNDVAKDGDELTLTCLPATKWLVNKDVIGDLRNINEILDVISKKRFSKVILISTIDVYNSSPLNVNEDWAPNVSQLNYGTNRLFFELMVKEMVKYDNLKIFRLPALFNKNIKKNILFDLINNNNIEQINENSFYQWYNLDKLKSDIEFFSSRYPDEPIINLFTEPIHTSEIVSLFPEHMDKVQNGKKITYNYQTKFGSYISNKFSVLEEIKQFVNEFSVK